MAPHSRKRHSSSSRRSNTKRPKHEQTLPGFLRLPVELRLQIYSYLLPDVPIIPARDDSNFIPFRPDISPKKWLVRPAVWLDRFSKLALRDDYQACHTSIMRVNKQICMEARDELCGKTAVEVEVNEEAVYFLRNKSLDHRSAFMDGKKGKELFDCLERFRHLYITVLPQAKPGHDFLQHRLEISSGARKFKDILNWIAWELKGHEGGEVPKRVTISYRDKSWPILQAEEGLKWHLRPFGDLRGLGYAQILHKPIARREWNNVYEYRSYGDRSGGMDWPVGWEDPDRLDSSDSDWSDGQQEHNEDEEFLKKQEAQRRIRHA
ncbi:hypothetical protein NA57DRAFT_80827 [Rhizodiscina lignyota]|uniref:F-box domain-containing protein n=1 Tax=Rhizodiscina lignyota TaxID=1504668 RepID=A0A9P4I8R0_9PEZI|nr:hypothetical protein NA57DRAFT_80827 [Rhizodiscina lignyota]